MRVILGLDVGSKVIGVARMLPDTGVAVALWPLKRAGVRRDVEALGRRLESDGFEVIAVVVGLPLDEDGAEQRSTRLARQVAEALDAAWPCEVHLQDETYSTLEAEHRLRARGIAQRKWGPLVDAEAAAVILEDWAAGRDVG